MRRIVDLVTCPGNGHVPVFQWLPQRIEQSFSELGDFIQIEYAIIGQGDLTRTRQGASADERYEAGTMVRCTERALPHQSAAADAAAGNRIDLARLDGFFTRHRWQDRGQARGHQALSTAGRSDKNQVVPPSGGNLQPAFGHVLAPDLAEIVAGGLKRPCIRRTVHAQRLAAVTLRHYLDSFGQGRHAIDFQPFQFRGFTGRRSRENAALEAVGPGTERYGQDAVDRPDTPVERQLAHNDETISIYGGNLFRDSEHPDGDSQVVGRAFLADVSRGQIDHQFPARYPETVGSKRRDDTKQALPHGTVGQPHQMDSDSGRQVDLHRNHDRLNPDAGRTIAFVQHNPSSLVLRQR